MRIAVSNLAWDGAEDPEALALLETMGVRGVELVPAKVWGDILSVSDADVSSYAREMEKRGTQVVALQAVLPSPNDFSLFNAEGRGHIAAYLRKAADIAVATGAKNIVYGAPGTRVLKGLPYPECHGGAVAFFRKMGAEMAAKNVRICLEPNAREYGCEFITTASEGAAFVREVASSGLMLHLDASCMTLAHDDPEEIVRNADILAHFHISEAFLKTFENPGSRHAEFALRLRSANYEGWTSIEMKRTVTPLDDVRTAIGFAQSVYG